MASRPGSRRRSRGRQPGSCRRPTIFLGLQRLCVTTDSRFLKRVNVRQVQYWLVVRTGELYAVVEWIPAAM